MGQTGTFLQQGSGLCPTSPTHAFKGNKQVCEPCTPKSSESRNTGHQEFASESVICVTLRFHSPPLPLSVQVDAVHVCVCVCVCVCVHTLMFIYVRFPI